MQRQQEVCYCAGGGEGEGAGPEQQEEDTLGQPGPAQAWDARYLDTIPALKTCKVIRFIHSEI